MKKRVLGRTGLNVSEIGFGAWGIAGNSYGKTDDAESLRAIAAAYDGGANFFDTADIYGNGHSEELIGKALAGRRASCVLASKVGWDFYHGGVRRNFSPEYVPFACAKSLERLGTDYLDLYQLHNPNLKNLQQEGLLEPFLQLKREGKIRFIGISIHNPEEGLQAASLEGVDVVQVIYNLIDQRPLAEFFPEARRKNLGIIAREPFACGLLTGKYTADSVFEGPDHRRGWKKEKIEQDLGKLERLKEVWGAKNNALPVLALEFVLAEAAVSTVIPGGKTAEQVRQNLSAAEAADFSAADVAKLQELYARDAAFQTPFFRN